MANTPPMESLPTYATPMESLPTYATPGKNVDPKLQEYRRLKARENRHNYIVFIIWIVLTLVTTLMTAGAFVVAVGGGILGVVVTILSFVALLAPMPLGGRMALTVINFILAPTLLAFVVPLLYGNIDNPVSTWVVSLAILILLIILALEGLYITLMVLDGMSINGSGKMKALLGSGAPTPEIVPPAKHYELYRKGEVSTDPPPPPSPQDEV